MCLSFIQNLMEILTWTFGKNFFQKFNIFGQNIWILCWISKWMEDIFFATVIAKIARLLIFFPFLSTTLYVGILVLKSASFFAFFDILSFLERKSFKGHVSTFQALKLNAHQTAPKNPLFINVLRMKFCTCRQVWTMWTYSCIMWYWKSLTF